MAGIAPCRSAVEAAYHEIERRRRDRLVELQRQLNSLPSASGTTDNPPAVLLSIHTQEEIQALTDALISAAGSTGWDLAAAVIRKPGDVHPLSRASRLAAGLKSRPIAAILLDVCRNELADVLPPTVPAIIWLTHRSSPDGILDRIGKTDQIMATDARMADSLTAAGVEATRITIAPLPCLLGDDDPPPDWDDRPIDVAICANLASTDPTVHGHDLPTHTKVWQTALERIRSRIDKFTDGDVPSMLTAAESVLRMRIDHPGARQSITRLLGGPAASALIWQDLVQHLARAKVKTDCWGLGWAADAGVQLRGPIPGLADRAAIYRQAKCVLFASPTGVVPADVLLAAAAGAVVIWRKHPLDTRPGGLANLLKPGEQAVVYAANRDLPRLVSSLLADAAAWRKITTAARQRCRTDHTPARAIALVKAAATSFRCVGPD
jgi:glycosyltransferase involved in cell wall biosynthesis